MSGQEERYVCHTRRAEGHGFIDTLLRDNFGLMIIAASRYGLASWTQTRRLDWFDGVSETYNEDRESVDAIFATFRRRLLRLCYGCLAGFAASLSCQYRHNTRLARRQLKLTESTRVQHELVRNLTLYHRFPLPLPPIFSLQCRNHKSSNMPPTTRSIRHAMSRVCS